MATKKLGRGKAKPPAEKREITERERKALGVLVNRRRDLEPPKFEMGDDGSMMPSEPTGDRSIFYARLAMATGTNQCELAGRLVQQAGQVSAGPDEDLPTLTNATAAAIAGIHPQNELEGLLATQMVASHGFAMELMRRSTCAKYIEHVTVYGNLAAKFLRLFVDQTDALARVRGKAGKQTVRVEHVHVESGAQAIVGNVAHGGEADRRIGESTP